MVIRSIGPLAHISFKQVVIPKKPFSPHDVNDVNNLILCAIEDTNWWNDKLAILCAFEFGGHRPTFWVTRKLFDSRKHSLNKSARSCWLIE
jgi:hypothetical protein